MVRKLVSATVSAALCMMTVAPGVALAQDYRFTGFDAPRGATATINLRVPMSREHREQASYGLTLGYGRTVGAPGFTGQTATRAVNFVDFRFAGSEIRQARVASFDLANLDRDRRVSNLTNPDTGWWLVGVGVAVGVAVCLLAECFDGDDDIDEPEGPGS